ncbi:MAG: hypothetical protein R3F56_18070 [Planctomycetota bacterium]
MPAVFRDGGDRRVVQCDGPWVRQVALVCVGGTFETKVADDEEALALVLGGTLDLFAGGSSWLQRGLRTTPFDGRPCAVYLPPKVGFRASGRGELLLVSGKRPPPRPTANDRPEPAGMPLLPLAGGKAFDARTGTWEMLERFPSSPEAVLPRAIERLAVGDVAVERVFSFAFKAQALCLDECVLGAGGFVTLPRPLTPPGLRYGDELLLFVRGEGTTQATQAGTTRTCAAGDQVLRLRPDADARIDAVDGRAYLAAVWAGPKPT